MAGIERHKIEPRRKKSSHTTISGPAKNQKLMEVMFPEKTFDHTPHSVFVEMDELIDNSWVEQGRWIKYEEAREEVCHLNTMSKCGRKLVLKFTASNSPACHSLCETS
jgi:hypothetical protein